jgi:hypothetical protein
MLKSIQPIQPQNLTTVKVICGFEVEVINVILNTSAKLTVRLYDQNNMVVNVQVMDLSGQDYKNWGSNDDYIINYVAQKLGFVLN